MQNQGSRQAHLTRESLTSFVTTLAVSFTKGTITLTWPPMSYNKPNTAGLLLTSFHLLNFGLSTTNWISKLMRMAVLISLSSPLTFSKLSCNISIMDHMSTSSYTSPYLQKIVNFSDCNHFLFPSHWCIHWFQSLRTTFLQSLPDLKGTTLSLPILTCWAATS